MLATTQLKSEMQTNTKTYEKQPVAIDGRTYEEQTVKANRHRFHILKTQIETSDGQKYDILIFKGKKPNYAEAAAIAEKIGDGLPSLAEADKIVENNKSDHTLSMVLGYRGWSYLFTQNSEKGLVAILYCDEHAGFVSRGFTDPKERTKILILNPDATSSRKLLRVPE